MPIVKTKSGLEKVFVDNLEELGDLSARTTITDSTSAVFLKASAQGVLEVSDSGELKANDGNDGAGTSRTVKSDASGVLFCKEVGTVNIAPANSVNSAITNSPTNSVSVGLTARQTIGTAGQTHLLCDSAGKLQVQVVGSNDINGGTPHRHLTIDGNGRTLTAPLMTSTNNKLDSIVTNTNKITQGEADVAGGGDGLQQILCYGKDNSGNLDPLNVDSDGHLKITLNNIQSGITNSIKTSLDSQTKSVNQYASQSLTGNGAWATTIDASGYGKCSIAVNSNATTGLYVYGSSTSGGSYIPFKPIFISSEDTGSGTHNLGFVEIDSPPDFMQIYNVDAGGVTLDLIVTLSN